MSRIRKSAQGKPCLLRIPGVCSGDWSTTVHCHVRRCGSGGMGKKPPDIIGIRACHTCHDWLDRRGFVRDDEADRDTWIADGMVRTLMALVAEGVIPG